MEVCKNNPNELRHYGVVGMKWGVRRAKKKGTTYSYKSWRTKMAEDGYDSMSARAKKIRSKEAAALEKGNAKKARKYADKAKVVEKEAAGQKKWAKASAKHDKGMQKIAESMSTGKAVASTLLTGGWNKTYHSILTSGEGSISKGKAAVATIFGGKYAEDYYLRRYLTNNS